MSVYRRGAEDGLVFGAYLSAVVLSIMLTVHIPMLSLLSVVLIAGVPFLAYRYLRRGVRLRGNTERFFEVWMHGISLFFFGALIMGVVMYVYMRLLDPNYITANIKQAIIVLRDNGGDGIETARKLQYMLDHKTLPGAIHLTFGTMWLVILSGSILTMLLSFIAIGSERRHPRNTQTPPSSGGRTE